MAKRMNAQMITPMFNPCDPIPIISFLIWIKLASDTNGVREVSAMWLFHFFINKISSAVQNARLSADVTDRKYSWSVSCKTKHFATFLQVLNVLLEKYATNEVNAETESEITRFKRPSNMTPSHYAEKLVTKKLQFGDVYEEFALNEIFIEGLNASTHHSIREY